MRSLFTHSIRTFFLASVIFNSTTPLSAQCTYTSAVSDITLQCSGSGNARTGVAWYPTENLYYSVVAGTPNYPIETFAATGGAALSSSVQVGDYRGFWYNPLLGTVEGNTFNSVGIFRHNLHPVTGYAVGTATNLLSGTMPNSQSCGAYDPSADQVLYYNGGTIYKHSRSTGLQASTVAVTGLPAGNISIYSLGYTGVAGSEVCLYDYTNQSVRFVNYNTGAYVSSCQLPPSAPTPGSYRMGYANNRIFLYDQPALAWYGYKVTAKADVVFSGNNIFCSSAANTTIAASGAVSHLWSTGSTSSLITVSPTTNTMYILYTTSQAGCTSANNFVVTVGQAPTLVTVASPSFQCDAFTHTISVSGANSYTWSVNASNASSVQVIASGPTTYTVVGTNSLCAATATVSVINDISPSVTLTASSPSICSGSSATLTAQGAASYSWTAGTGSTSVYVVTPTAYTGYTVTGFSQYGCSTPFYSEDTLSIKVIQGPVATASASSNNICLGESLSLNGGGGISYLWMPGNLSPQNVSVAPSSTTVYTLTVGDGTCSSMAMVSVSVSTCLNIGEVAGNSIGLQVWPNPSRGSLYIRTNSAATLQIVNAQGQLVRNLSTDADNNYTATIEQLSAGLYFVTGGGITQKLVVE